MNALIIYIISCMIFISFAMVYYDFLLYIIRKKEETEETEETEERLFKLDQSMLTLYELTFILFNAIYFS